MHNVNMKHDDSFFIGLLKSEVVPALGCTEPIAVALASAKAREVLGYEPDRIDVVVSHNILKNGMGVGIPGTGMVGLHIAAALGVIGGNADAVLEVLKDISPKHIEKAKEYVKESKVTVKSQDTESKLYVQVSCYFNEHSSCVTIEQCHSNITSIVVDGKEMLKRQCSKDKNQGSKDVEVYHEDTSHTNIKEIYNFATAVEFEKIEFILQGAVMNKTVALEGLKNNYGLKVGKTLKDKIDKHILSDDIQNRAMAMTAAASDARMAGCMLPVMSNSGSGNQGITVMMPVVVVAEHLNVSEEKLARALVIANLVAIHIKSYLGRLSALCGCVVASSGASAGIVYLMDGDETKIEYAIKNMTGNIAGMICDGAKTGCALKVSTGVSAAIQSALLAMDGIEISYNDGIIDRDIEKTIENLAKIGRDGMTKTDELILDIMTCK
ncbi:L-cysteine desulfidase [Hathewaya proteolytica DSM 3090]|uniref:UPF0597 protein SAMN02745248_01298 n=1 Tax=Hathewaya proteolytica DSM 3090 TaxID=1121331 RepID=A0A1M6N718_9CLOT|nr:L-cysteine desulfidase [Hathewaya proteolytica DSM 3090]